MAVKKTPSYKVGDVFSCNGKSLTILEVSKRNDRYYYTTRCNICGWDGNTLPSEGVRECRCSCCSGKTVVQGINDIPTTAPWMVKYFQGGHEEAKNYTRRSNKKIYPICPECGCVKTTKMSITNLHKYKSIGCDCQDGISYPNKMIHQVMTQLNVLCNFPSLIFEYQPDWSGRRFYDVYFEHNEKKYIIEMDGYFHYNDNQLNGTMYFESLAVDNKKEQMAIEQGINVIRINCNYKDVSKRFEYIKKNIMESELSNILPVNLIDWEAVFNNSSTNIMRLACKMYQENPLVSTSEIGKQLGIQGQTVSKYLKQGTSYGWCNYDTKQVMVESGKALAVKSRKSVVVYKDGTLLSDTPFESLTELAEKSLDIFGVPFLLSGISSVCSGKKDSYKGYVFKYAELEKGV